MNQRSTKVEIPEMGQHRILIKGLGDQGQWSGEGQIAYRIDWGCWSREEHDS
jgi:hypothetical protein